MKYDNAVYDYYYRVIIMDLFVSQNCLGTILLRNAVTFYLLIQVYVNFTREFTNYYTNRKQKC